MSNVYNELKERGLISQITDEGLIKKLDSPITLYCGFDPTGDSLHIGHLLPIVIMKHFENYGHKNLAVVGGATGLIGDPSFKKEERSLNSKETVVKYSESIESQLVKYLDGEKVEFLNNYDWTANINVLDFLRDYGKNFTINYMLAKDCVSSRLDTGLSFTEFAYTILQALDFNHLYQNHNCELQIGGSDQWGNITSGLELIRRENEDAKAYGLTIPLVTKSDGTKFGKTEGGAIWLNPEKTTPYEFYQFFLNTADDDVIKYLKFFTFLNIDEIKELEKDCIEAPHLRNAQKALAYEITKFVHGEQSVEQVLKITKCLFTGDISELSVEEIQAYFTDIKQYELTDNLNILDALIMIELANSKREAREFVNAGSITIAGEKITDLEYVVSSDIAIGGLYLMVKRGKKKIHFVKVV
jgi:tyrosyl-tRNA synthetase